MKTFFYFLFFIVLYGHSIAAFYKYDMTFSTMQFNDDLSLATNDTMNDVTARLDFNDSFGDFSYRMYVSTTIDMQNSLRNKVNFEDTWLQYSKGSWVVKAGSQLINWSALTVFHPADVINTRIYDGDFTYPSKWGQPMVSLSRRFSDASLTAFYIPTFIEPTYADEYNRLYALTNESYGFDWNGDVIGDDWLGQWSLLYEFMIGSADISLHYVSMIDRLQPTVVLDNTTFTYNQAFLPVQQVGGTAQSVVKDVLVNVEWAIRDFSDESTSEFGELSQYDHTQIALGAQKVFMIKDRYTFMPMIEYQRYLGVTKDERAWLGVFQNDVMLGARFMLNDAYNTFFYTMVTMDIERANEYIFATYFSRRITDYWSVQLGSNFFLGEEASDYLGLTGLQDADYLYLQFVCSG